MDTVNGASNKILGKSKKLSSPKDDSLSCAFMSTIRNLDFLKYEKHEPPEVMFDHANRDYKNLAQIVRKYNDIDIKAMFIRLQQHYKPEINILSKKNLRTDGLPHIFSSASTLIQTTDSIAIRSCMVKVIEDFSEYLDVAKNIIKLTNRDKAIIVDAMHYGDNDELRDYPEEVIAIARNMATEFQDKYGHLVPHEAALGAENTVRTIKGQKEDATNRKTLLAKAPSASSEPSHHQEHKIAPL